MRSTFILLLALAMVICGLTVFSVVVKWYKVEALRSANQIVTILFRERNLLYVCQDINLASRGYAFNKSPELLARYEKDRAKLPALIEELGKLVGDRAIEQRVLNTRWPTAVAEFLKTSQDVLDNASPADVTRQQAAMASLRSVLEGVIGKEAVRLGSLRGKLRREDLIFWSVLSVQLLVGLALILAVIRSFARYRNESLERITVIEKAKQEAQTARTEAEAALAATSRVLSTLSHEVRTPMAGLIGLTELLSLEDLGSDTNENVLAILSSSRRLLQILNNVLDAAKLHSGKVELECRQFPIRALIGDVRQLVLPEAAKKDLKVTGVCDPGIPEYVCGDELRVRQVFMNLAFNAIKFTEKGELQVSAELKELTGEQVVVRFSVIDTGIGILPEEQSRLFQPFVQLQDPTKRVAAGTGLGLSISKDLVELMGGEMGLASERGKGSTFWFEIGFRSENCRL